MIGQNVNRAKTYNTSLILKIVYEFGPISRKEMARLTQLTPATISNLTGELIEEGILTESPIRQTTNSVGRREVMLEIKSRSHCVAAVHVARNRLSCAIMDLAGTILERQDFHLHDTPLPSLLSNIQGFLEKSPRRNHILGIGVGYYGPMVTESSLVLEPRPYPSWLGSDLRDAIAAVVSVPVVVNNNVQNMALAEKLFGSTKHVGQSFLLYVDIGVGGGLIIDGAPSHLGPVEVGHMSINIHGPKCWCGNRGCVELYTGEKFLLEKAVQAAPELFIDSNSQPSFRQLLQADTSSAIQPLLENAAKILGAAIVNTLHVVSVEEVILCGRIFGSTVVMNKMWETIGNVLPVDEQKIRRSSIPTDNIGLLGAGSLSIYNHVIHRGKDPLELSV